MAYTRLPATFAIVSLAVALAGNSMLGRGAHAAQPAVKPASAGTYYVSLDGKPEFDGSMEKPWPSVEYALSKVGAGNTIIVKPGLYSGPWQIRNYTAKPEGPLTLVKSEVKWRAIVAGSAGEGISVVNCPGLVLDGFEVCGARMDGIGMNTDQGTVRNCWVHNNAHMGISSHKHKNLTLECNLIEFNGCNVHFHHGVYADGEKLTIRRNIIRHNSGFGLHLYPSIENSVVSQNLVYGQANEAGIIVACPKGGGRNLIVNNTVADNARCITIWDGDGEKVFNNILVSAREVLTPELDTRNIVADYNLCSPKPAYQGPNGMAANPQFVNSHRGIFWLLRSSPAIGKGSREYAQATDFWGRPLAPEKAPDLGAFAFVPALAEKADGIGWNGWPYHFAPKHEMELRDLWTLSDRKE
jgi:parallel beta-helix repeat protein